MLINKLFKLLLLCFVVMIFGCNKQQIKDSNINIISRTNNSATIIGYNSDFKLENKYPLNNTIIQNSTTKPIKYNSKLYFINTNVSNTNELIELNLSNGNKKLISNKNESPNFFEIINDKLYYSSNYIEDNKLNLIDLNNQNNKKSYQFKDYLFNKIICVKNMFFAFTSKSSDFNQEQIIILDSNLNMTKEIKIKDKVNISSNIINKDNMIYYLSSNEDYTSFYINYLNIDNNEIKQSRIELESPNRLVLHDNKIFVNNANVFDRTKVSNKLLIYNIENNKIEYINTNENVYDITIKDNYLLLLKESNISLLDTNSYKVIKDIKITKDKDYYLDNIISN